LRFSDQLFLFILPLIQNSLATWILIFTFFKMDNLPYQSLYYLSIDLTSLFVWYVVNPDNFPPKAY